MKVSVVVAFGSVLPDKKVSFEQNNDTIDQYTELRAIALDKCSFALDKIAPKATM